ncbi:helix-turn-helix domain-containing protein [Paenibacillus sp. NRS-1782]|uniref:PucR family transcriptional regulator n=1 Tax=unclassified Paenibacillus TaxID=185978 RepID=UPI003D2A1EC4
MLAQIINSIEVGYKSFQPSCPLLLPTLGAYLQYVDTPNLAAKTLFIHRNTLFYRINRIRELFQIDLSNGDIRLKLQLTLHFLKPKTQRGEFKDESIEG